MKPTDRPGGAAPSRSAATRLTYLAEASRLLADSLEYETTLTTVARLALPDLGAWCIVDVVQEDGELRRLAIVHPDVEKQPLVRKLESGWPPERDDPLGVPRVVNTRRSELIPEVTDEMLADAAHTEENLRILRQLGIGSLIVAPLIARGHVLGAMTFVGARGGPGYTEDDLAFAEDLAGRCAIAIDNARLFQQAQRARARAEIASLEAQAASRAKSQFLTMVTHEIRTPINAIIGYADLLLMGIDGPLTEAQREKLERLQASSQHLLGLINQVLDLAKVEAGQMKVQREKARAADAVATAYEIVYPQALEHAIELTTRCEGEDLWYVGDANRVRQVLVNLMGNATKFTEVGGRITVTCGLADEPTPEARLSGDGPWIRIDVADTGIGIPEEKIADIFEPFVQLESGLTRSESGTGLGLAISRQLARLMGGDLTVRSTPGEGSCFTLWLPPAPTLSLRAAPQERRLYDRTPGDLPRLGAVILDRMGPILDAYVGRLRDDPRIPRGAESNDPALRHHALNFLTGVAQALGMVHESGDGVTDVMRDGTRIQRMISELHGAQRHRLGWSEDALRRDFEVLQEVVTEEVRRVLEDGREADEGLEVLERIFTYALRIAVQAWRLAEARREG